MTTTAFIGLLVLAGAGWCWFDSMRALEIARAAGRRRCAELGLSLLDDTVVLTRLRLRRTEAGHMTVYREYQFEFTGDGVSRHGGEIVMLGGRIISLVMEPYREPSAGGDGHAL